MNGEEFKKSIRELQKEAAKMDAALSAAEERKEVTKMVAEERAKQGAKKRTFANPKNADEATGKIPTLEQLANGTPDLHPDGWRWKSKEEILEDGTLLEKFRLFFSSGDLGNYFDTKDMKLTKKETAKIVASIRTREDRKLAEICTKEYQALIAYGKQLSYFFKRFQTTYAMLAMQLNKWDDFENTAEKLTFMYQSMVNTYSKQFLELWINKQEKQQVFFNGAELKFNRNDGFWIDVDMKVAGLYNDVKKEAKDTTEALADFKAFVVVIEEFIRNSTLRFVPISIQMAIENAKKESYTRYLVKNRSFFRSELNLRKERGESITPEEEKRAVIPDYYEVTPPQNMYKSCQRLIKQLMN